MSLQANAQVATESTATQSELNDDGKTRKMNGRKSSTTRKPRTPSPAEANDQQAEATELMDRSDATINSDVDTQSDAVAPPDRAKNVDENTEIPTHENSPNPALEASSELADATEVSPCSVGKPEKFAIELTTEKLIELLQKVSQVEFFHDQHGNPFVWVPTIGGTSYFECLPLHSKAFRARLVQLAESYSTRPTPAAVINNAIKAGELLAFKVKPRKLANRHRSVDGQIAIDLGDLEWRMIDITGDGWKLCKQTEAMFFRPQHMKPLPEPIGGGDPFEFFDFMSVEHDDDKLLVLCWLVSALCPDVPSPILNLTGIQGSAKTTKSKRLRDLTDPSVTPVLGDLEMSNLFLTFQHHAVPSFENVSKFDRRTADMFCRAVTGNGVERRKLFTNSDQVLYSFRRPIIINGIDTPSTRPDFLDRCIVINCERIKAFRPLKGLDEAFQKARPRLFGSLLDLLVATLRLLPQTDPSGEFRMADFAHFGRAIAVALGKTPTDFDNAYRSNIRLQDKEALDATPLTIAIKAFAKRKPANNPWKGSAQLLLGELRATAIREIDPNVLGDLPKNARWLSSKLGELVTALKTDGVVVERLPRTSSTRGWKIWIEDEANERRRSKMTPDKKIDDDLDNRDLFTEKDEDEPDSPT